MRSLNFFVFHVAQDHRRADRGVEFQLFFGKELQHAQNKPRSPHAPTSISTPNGW